MRVAGYEIKDDRRRWMAGLRTVRARLAANIITFNARRKAEVRRRERLKLGRHLLKDLGFNTHGYPLPHWRRCGVCCHAGGGTGQAC